MKHKHRIKIKQGLSLLLAGGIALTNLGAALPAFAEDAAATPETASAATPETAEANVPTPNLSQITENLYNDLPDAPTGSYLGSMGLPVATGETKIGISAWVSDLYDGVDAHMDADALNADENTVTIGKTPGTDYAIVPLLAQVEYPADGAVSEIILPDGVELLSYLSTDYEPIPADEQEQAEILHHTYSEQSAAATGLYVKASADFTAQLVYTDSDGSSQSKSIQVQISEDAAPTQMYADTGDDGIAAYAAGPTPPYTTGKITSIAKEGGTWLIWFNGQEAYCCSHGLNGQPKGCPTYSFSHVSRLEPGQYTPGNHYANQVNIWGGLGQLSLDMLDDRPVVASLEDDPEGCEEQPDILGSLYDETQQWIMENYPDSYAAQTYIAAAEELINGTDVVQNGTAGDEYIDPADGLIHCKKVRRPEADRCAMLWETRLLHAPLYLPVSAGGRGTAQGRRGTAAPHGAHQAPEGPGPARPLSVRLHLCQRQRPKSPDGQGPRLCGELEGGIQEQHRPAVVWGCGNRQVLFRRLYRQRPA